MREAELAQAERHVALATQHIARQRKIIERFRRTGIPTDAAEDLLILFEDMQLLHIAHRDRLLNSK